MLLKKSEEIVANPGYSASFAMSLPAASYTCSGLTPETENAYCPWFWLVAPVLISRTGYGRRSANMPGTALIFPMSSPATAAMGARSSGGLRKVNVMPWFEDRNALFPVMVNAVITLSSDWSTWSARA